MKKIKKDDLLTMKINSELKKDFQKQCIDNDLSMSQQIEILIKKFLDEEEVKFQELQNTRREKIKELLEKRKQLENYYK